MRRLVRASLVFAGGILLVSTAGLGARSFLVAALGERLYWLPELQVERMLELFARSPVTDARLLILGDSTATFSVTAKDFPGADSLATINSTSIEAYFTLRHVLDSGARPRCVLYSASLVWEANHAWFWPMFAGRGFYSDGELEEIFRVSAAAGDSPGAEGAVLFGLRRFLYRRNILDSYSLRSFQDALLGLGTRRERVRGFRGFTQRERGSNPLTNHVSFEGRTELTYAADPSMNPTEREFFRRFAELLHAKGIPLFVLEVPFADSVPSAYSRDFWMKYEHVLATVRPGTPVPFTPIAPAPLPAARYLGVGHLDAEGARLIEPELRRALTACTGDRAEP